MTIARLTYSSSGCIRSRCTPAPKQRDASRAHLSYCLFKSMCACVLKQALTEKLQLAYPTRSNQLMLLCASVLSLLALLVQKYKY